MYKLLFKDYIYFITVSSLVNTLLIIIIDGGNFDIRNVIILYLAEVVISMIQLIISNEFKTRQPVTQLLFIYGLSALVSFIMLCLLFYTLAFERFSIANMVLLAVVTTPFQLSILFFNKHYYQSKLVKQKEQLIDNYVTRQKEKEIEVLKQQIDPHFIFNSFNTLSYLIGDDTERAKAFSDKLANVYRYIIFNSNKNLVCLTEELEFARDYSFLQEMRHSNEIQVTFSGFSDTGNILILPVSIQILIENAIKHNEFSDVNPLRILVTLDTEFISVENKKKIRQHNIPISSRIGLNNLKERCELIMRRELIILNNPSGFKVQIPIQRH